MKKINQFIYETINGETYASLNPEWEKRQAEIRYDCFLKDASIPTFYKNIEFKNFAGDKNDLAFKKIVYYAEHIAEERAESVNLFLFGVASTQKTALGINILKEAMRKGLRSKYIESDMLINKLLKVQGFKVDEEIQDELKKINEYKVVMVDDIFSLTRSTMYAKETGKNLIFTAWNNFLRNLINNNVRLILTSGSDVESIRKNFDESLYELIYTNFEPIHLTQSVKHVRKAKASDFFKEVK